jgi:hypothetical protein
MKTASFQNMLKHDTQCSIVYWIQKNQPVGSRKATIRNFIAMKKRAYYKNQKSQK